jgi:hypothetical protein
MTEQQEKEVSYGLQVVKTERLRQVSQHDWTPEWDDQYVNGELGIYATYWLTPEWQDFTREALKDYLQTLGSPGWEDEWFKYDERTPEQRLARAGALIAAEITRLQRLQAAQQK